MYRRLSVGSRFCGNRLVNCYFHIFLGNPDEGSDFISKGLVASAIFILYTRKMNPIFSDFQNRIFDFDIAALDMMNLELSYIFPRSRINLPFVVSSILLGVIVETKVIRETTLKNHISSSGEEYQYRELGWNRLGVNLIYEASDAFGVYTCPVKQGIIVKRVESDI